MGTAATTTSRSTTARPTRSSTAARAWIAATATWPTRWRPTARASSPPEALYAARSMRAIQIEEFGGREVLQLVELPVPEPGPGEVLVRVTRAGVNFADTHQRQDQYVAAQQLPMIRGGEVAGVREDTGERVVALCGHGGYAQYATAPASLCFPIPDGVDDGTALALLIQGLTAWHLYRTAGRLAHGETVVVHSAAGGVGSLAVQLGKHMGAGRGGAPPRGA